VQRLPPEADPVFPAGGGLFGLKRTLDDEWARKNAQAKEVDESSGNLLAQSVVEYVRDRMRMAALETIADNLRVSPSYLSRVFKEQTGRTFSEYLMEERMRAAAELLKDVRNKTFEVAYLVGYTDPKNFTRAFRAYYGSSPREYRSHLKNKN
jgi:YesN/AraC family two-component response regulator